MQRTGKRRKTPCLVMVWCSSERERPRFGLTVSRKVGNAVVRNRVKRQLRESIRRQRHGLTHLDVVFIARPDAANADHHQLFDQVGSLLAALRSAR